MAKWGEGDPRWIVEERADATNVNNWHWTEKNATGWSKDKLKSLLTNLVLEDEKFFAEIKELTKIEGEASANNRKSKLFFFYEWEIKADWKGKLKAEDKAYKGTLEIPNLSEEHAPEDVDVNVGLKEGHEEGFAVKEFIRTKGVEVIRQQLATYIKDLKSEYSRGMILPTKDDKSTTVHTATNQNGVNTAKEALNQTVATGYYEMSSVGVKVKCKNLKGEEEFKCTASDLYNALTDQNMVRAFTTSDAQVDATKGGKFVLFGGNVTGSFTELIKDKKIVMQWRFRNWPEEHYSLVTLDLEQRDDCTIIKLNQTGVPSTEYEKTQEGWKNYYWRSIKQRLGFGACLF